MNTGQIFELAVQTLAEYGLTDKGWRVAWDDGKRRAGACHYQKRVISLSRHIMPTAPEAEVRETILHEVAHALTPGHHHDDVWRAKLIEMGGTGNRTHSMETVPGRYDVICVNCGVIGNRHHAQGVWKRLVGNPSGATHTPYYTHRKCHGGLWLRDNKSERPLVNVPETHAPIAASGPKPKPKPERTRTGDRACLCGCGEWVTNNYRPGHDARHLSATFKEWLASGVDTNIALDRMPTEALKAKMRKRIEDHANHNYK